MFRTPRFIVHSLIVTLLLFALYVSLAHTRSGAVLLGNPVVLLRTEDAVFNRKANAFMITNPAMPSLPKSHIFFVTSESGLLADHLRLLVMQNGRALTSAPSRSADPHLIKPGTFTLAISSDRQSRSLYFLPYNFDANKPDSSLSANAFHIATPSVVRNRWVYLSLLATAVSFIWLLANLITLARNGRINELPRMWEKFLDNRIRNLSMAWANTIRIMFGRSPGQILIICGGIVTVLAVYITAASMLKTYGTSHYVNLMEALYSGQTYLHTQPNPVLAQLEDPYNPKMRKESKAPYVWDLVYHNNRYYLSWGPFPALAHQFLPKFLWPMVTQFTVLACLIFLIQTAILLRIFGPPKSLTSSVLYILAIFTLGFSSPVFLCLFRPATWEVQNAWGTFLFSLAIWFVVSELCSEERNGARLLLISSLIGAALLSRISLSLAAGAMVSLLLCRSFIETPGSVWRRCLASIPIAVPATLAVLLLLIYNYVRFGDFFDFGIPYVLGMDNALFNSGYLPGHKWEGFLQGVRLLLFNAPETLHSFPYIKNIGIKNLVPGSMMNFARALYGFYYYPVLLGFLWYPIVFGKRVITLMPQKALCFFVTALLVCGSITLFLVTARMNYITSRYFTDFDVFLKICCIILWFALFSFLHSQIIEANKRHFLMFLARLFFVIFSIVSIWSGFFSAWLFSLHGGAGQFFGY